MNNSVDMVDNQAEQNIKWLHKICVHLGISVRLLHCCLIMAVISVLSLNCHGFTKDTELYLHRVCNNIDVILLQETWLSDAVSAKIAATFPDFVVFHSSAMEYKLACG